MTDKKCKGRKSNVSKTKSCLCYPFNFLFSSSGKLINDHPLTTASGSSLAIILLIPACSTDKATSSTFL